MHLFALKDLLPTYYGIFRGKCKQLQLTKQKRQRKGYFSYALCQDMLRTFGSSSGRTARCEKKNRHAVRVQRRRASRGYTRLQESPFQCRLRDHAVAARHSQPWAQPTAFPSPAPLPWAARRNCSFPSQDLPSLLPVFQKETSLSFHPDTFKHDLPHGGQSTRFTLSLVLSLQASK